MGMGAEGVDVLCRKQSGGDGGTFGKDSVWACSKRSIVRDPIVKNHFFDILLRL